MLHIARPDKEVICNMENSPNHIIGKPCWFVLNHIGNVHGENQAQKTLDRFNKRQNTRLELFAPTYVVKEDRDGKVCMRRLRLAFHYVFVRGVFDEVKCLCSQPNGFSFLINHSGSERYAILGDREMRHFREIARVYENCLPFYSLEDVDLEEGDLVEVINGDFPGLIGTFMPKAKSKSGNVVLMVDRKWGTVAYDIKASDVRVLEFASTSNRAYDQIDAFVPHLLKALRFYHCRATLPAALSSKLNVFCSRFEITKISNTKLQAKLLALLSAANYLIGNTEAFQNFRERFDRTRHTISNSWTEALILLIFSTTETDIELFKKGCDLIERLEATSKFQKYLTEEYSYYKANMQQSLPELV